ncbi:MAG TPA: alpha/beta hydrolase [Streptomyces sp.]
MNAQHNGSYAKVNGLEMYYEVHGPDAATATGAASDGSRPLVLLHGGVLTIDLCFGALLPLLARTRRVIAVELQGHGHTADIDREMTVPALSSDVLALMDELGVEQADFFGFSLGGLTALQTAVARPERVGRLVIASTEYRPDGYYDEILHPEQHWGSARLPSEADFQEMAGAYARTAPDPAHFQDFLAKCTATAHSHPGWSDEELRALAVPTLMVIGDTDFVRIDHAADMLRLIPDAELAVLPATTHMQVTHRTTALVPMLEEFLGR